ncbi:hypothetical protein JTE90_016597 [Oedothorax gibbosus]|uniref:Ubiquitin carboxyl-terminal hydrolase 36 n=1 Tax=Oedothorax gibbosus TaxID=931172 RepID=A0AAV6UAC6_9ARAC|nr:hypothetical protein JTE90_016597 [Oedothorax gibbosus]
MNSTIASNINGTLAAEKKDSLTQKIAIGSRSSLLTDNINFSLTGTKKPSSGSSIPGQFLCRLNISEPHLNGQKKLKNEVDQNRNPFNNSYVTINGNKDITTNGNKVATTNGNKVVTTNGNKEKAAEDGMPIPKVQLYKGKIEVEWKQVYKIGAGLHNLGNTCFMNSVIQCLIYCPPLANYLMLDNDHSSKCQISRGAVNGFCMMCILQEVMRRVIGKQGEVIKPMEFHRRLKSIAKHFIYGRQEDAHEFLRYVIDHLWKSCLPQNSNCAKLDPASKETTVVNQIFGGYHRSQVTCLRCKEKSNTYDHFMDFILDIKQNVMSLQKALEKYTHPELLDQENSYKCPKCKMKVTAQKKFTVYKPPNVATFQLKRFDYIRSFSGKITKPINYPERLNLRPYMSESKGDPVWYRLNAVLVHSGSSCHSGHYYCYVRNSNGNWYIMDDSKVTPVKLSTVLDQCAYVLFYIKSETPQGPTFKKCFDNRDSILKGSITAGTYKKIPDTPLKSSPLAERNQVKASSPTIKPQLCSPVNGSKKFPVVLNGNRDRITFEVRASMPTIQDIHKSAVLLTPSKNPKQSDFALEKSNKQNGLVPYVKDSSESSDENENSEVPVLKTTSREGLSENTKPNGAIFLTTKGSNEKSDKIEIKRNLSKPFMKLSKFSPVMTNGASKISPALVGSFKSKMNSSYHSNSSPTPPKVIATGSWTVTEAPASPSAGSTCSSNSVTSTSDWHVTSTDPHVDTPVNSSVSKPNGVGGGCSSFSNISIYSSPKQTHKTFHPSKSQEDNEISSCGDLSDSVYSIDSSSKKSDFRSEQSQPEQTFLEDRKPSGKYSFLKRKYIDYIPKNDSHSPESKLHKDRFNCLPKKAKYSEECTESDSKQGLKLISEDDKSRISKHEDLKHSEYSSFSKKNKYSEEGPESPSKNSESKSTKDKKRSKESERKHRDSDTSPEYVWVEKTKDNIESNHQSPVKEKISKYTSPANTPMKTERKHDVVSELTKNSQFFYGASVPTWNGEKHYKESPHSQTEKRKPFEDYEDEYDRGKTRKYRPKDRYQHYYKHKDSFQDYSERTFHSKHNGNFNYGRHNHYSKPYDSHHKWKHNRSFDHQRHRNHFRPNFRR